MLSVVEIKIKVSGYGPRADDTSQGIERQRAIGSGVLLSADGYIITNNHGVTGAPRVRVLLALACYCGTRLLPHQPRPPATSLWSQADRCQPKSGSCHDQDRGKSLPFIALLEQFRVRLGQTGLAIGSPEGLDHTVTKGIVSAAGRWPELGHPMMYLQTDAPINPGNSGDPWIDRDGSLTGINTFILSAGGGSEGLVSRFRSQPSASCLTNCGSTDGFGKLPWARTLRP